MKTDVAVVGGGSAGLAAAVTAARQGARVILIERQGMLGGMATSSLVHSLCGLYRLRESEAEPLVPSNHGFSKEFSDLLMKEGGARGPVRMGRLDVLLHRPAAFAALADRLAGQLPNLQVVLHSEISEVHRNGNAAIAGLTLNCRGSRLSIESSVVVETTGDAEVARLAGVCFDSLPLDKLQRPAYIFGIGGVESEAMSENGRLRIAHAISRAVMSGLLPQGALGIAFRMGVGPSEVWGTIDLQAEGFDPDDSHGLSMIEREGREIACKVINFLKREVSGVAEAFITAFPSRAGIRESRRVPGHYQMTESDILSGRRFEDEVAFSSWPIELRETAKGARFRFPLENRSCGIPLRSLRARDLKNLFVAGRCLSSTHEAQAAIRVIGTCLATGEAAGKAAAEMAHSGSLASF